MTDMIHVPEMLTLKEASQRTHLSYDFLRSLCLQKRIVFIKTGSKYLINFEALVDYLNKGDAYEK